MTADGVKFKQEIGSPEGPMQHCVVNASEEPLCKAALLHFNQWFLTCRELH